MEELVPSHVNAFLIDTGDKRILIDAGAGDLQGSTLGDMARRLLAAGYSVGDIDTVLVTHLHPDHIGGLTRSGEAVFERARIHVSRAEAAFWLERGSADGVDGSVRATFADARKVLAPYIATDRLRLFDAQASWHGCINALALPGHTHGHTGFRLRTGKQDVLFCGDLFHVAAVQLADPGVTVCYDSEPAQAKATRVAFLKEAAHRGDCIAAAHAPFPGLGIVCREGDGYVWQPAA
ncbi:MAG TPA: MBL fold metallo-hydrolase [Dyella sp.]